MWIPPDEAPLRGLAREVHALLRERGPMSPCEIQEALGRPERTVRYALRVLERRRLIDWRHSPRDGRGRRYFPATRTPPP